MEDNKSQNAIAEIKKITMTASEKKQVLESVLNYSPLPQKEVITSWSFYSFFSNLKHKQLFYYGVTASFIFIIGGGGVVFAAQGSLPDSPLYPIKVSVVEPIVGALTLNPESKAKYESSLATNRLVEAETLARKGKLNTSEEKKISVLLASHTEALNKALDQVSKTDKKESVDEIVVNFKADMNAHARVLDILNNKVTSGERSVMAVSSPNNSLDTNVSETARGNANSLGNVKGNKIEKSNEKYLTKKNSVQSLIDSTNADISNTTSSVSSVDQTVINDAHQTIDRAEQLLNEADSKEKNGQRNEAYSSLLDSESSIKEANIFLKTGLKLNSKSN